MIGQTDSLPPPNGPPSHRGSCFSSVCGWMCKSEGWLRATIGLQALVATARLLTPRPLVSVANFFLVFLGFNITATPAVIRLFFLSFFALILGLSDVFWLVMKFTGPFGSAWLDPRYYWRPIYPSVYDRAYLVPNPPYLANPPESTLSAGETKPGPPPLPRMYPPERAPAVWQIYIELVCFCVSPLVCFLTAWLAWRIYKRNLLELQASEVRFFLPSGEPEYGATGNAASPPGFYAPDPSRAVGESQPLLQPSRGVNAFVPFAGEGMRLGGDDAGRGHEDGEKREETEFARGESCDDKI